MANKTPSAATKPRTRRTEARPIGELARFTQAIESGDNASLLALLKSVRSGELEDQGETNLKDTKI